MTTKKCSDCINWKSTGEENYQGKCIMSANCVNDKAHPRFTAKTEVRTIPEIRPRKGGAVGTIAYIDTNSAKESRVRQQPLYPDGAELTGESKKELRKERREERRKHVSKTA